MSAVVSTKRRSLPLLGVAFVLLVLLLVLALVGEEHGGGVACVPVAPAGAAVPAPSVVDAAAVGSRALERPPAAAEGSSPQAAASTSRVPVVAGNVSGLVVDRDSREPVPFVGVRIAGAGEQETVSTDADGAFVTRELFRGGVVHATVIDDGVEIERFEANVDGSLGLVGWILDVPIGPTYPLPAIDGRVTDAAAWTAQLYESTLDPDVAGEIAVRPTGLEIAAPAADAPDREWTLVRVRDAKIPFARWPTREHAADRRYRATLVLRSTMLFARADVRVQATVGVHRPLSASSKPRAIVAGDLVRSGKRSGRAPGPLRAVLFHAKSEKDSHSSPPEFREVDATAEGFRFDDVPPGSWSLVVWGPNAISDLARVQVTRGDLFKTKPLQLEVAGEEQGAALERWRKSRDGLVDTREVSQVLVVAPRNSMHATRSLAVRADSLGPEVLALEQLGYFGNSADVRVVGIGGGSAYPETLKRTSRLAGRVDRGDLDPSKRVRFAVAGYVGAASAPSGVGIAFGPAGSTFTVRDLDTNLSTSLPTSDAAASVPWILAPARAKLSWSAWAAGYAPVFGSETDFTAARVEPGGPPLRIAEARLRPGWGTMIALRAGDPAEIEKSPWPWRGDGSLGDRRVLGALAAPPVPGVGVLVDGSVEAPSDEAGEIRLSTVMMPVRLTLRAKGWRLCALEPLEGPGARYIAWLKRTK